MIRSTAAGLLLLALAGCNKGPSAQSDAPVPVLSGSVSDAMLPLDQVTSQPPLDPRAGRTLRKAEEPEAAGTGEPAAPAAATPVPTASAAAGALPAE